MATGTLQFSLGNWNGASSPTVDAKQSACVFQRPVFFPTTHTRTETRSSALAISSRTPRLVKFNTEKRPSVPLTGLTPQNPPHMLMTILTSFSVSLFGLVFPFPHARTRFQPTSSPSVLLTSFLKHSKQSGLKMGRNIWYYSMLVSPKQVCLLIAQKDGMKGRGP